MNNKLRGAIYMTLSSLSFSMMSLVVKLSSDSVTLYQQVFFRNIVCLFIAFLCLKKEKLPMIAEMKYQPFLFARSLGGLIGVFCLFRANALASQADVALLSRTSPIFVSLFAFLFMKEKISKVQIPVIILCMIGAVLAINPTFNSDIFPLLLALMVSVVSGITYNVIAFCKGMVHPMVIIFHFCVFSIITAGILMIPGWQPIPLSAFPMLLLIGVFAAGGQIGMTYAMQQAPSSQISIYDYTGLIFSAIIGLVALGEPIKFTTLIGSILIIAGGLWSYIYNNKHE